MSNLAGRSEVIVMGTVASVEPGWDANRERIWTTVTMLVERTYRSAGGQAETVSFLVPGGEVDGVGQVVPGAPKFASGERAIVLLERDAAKGCLTVCGFNQGKYVPFKARDGRVYWTRAALLDMPLEISPLELVEQGLEKHTLEELEAELTRPAQ